MAEHWQDWRTGQPKHFGDLWTLTKGGRLATCVLRGHPIGCEARVEVNGDFKRSAAFKEGVEAVKAAEEWRELFEGNGWRRIPNSSPR